MMNAMRAGKTTTTSIDNGDETVTTVTTTYKSDGTKVTKRKTTAKAPEHPYVPVNASRSKTPPPRRSGMTPPPQRAARSLTPPKSRGGDNSMRSSAHYVDEMKQELKKVLGYGHADNHEFTTKVTRAIPAEIVLLASQDDVTQAQEGDTAITKYGLPSIPNTHSTSGSLATCAFLQLLFENPKRVVAGNSVAPLNCRQVITQVQKRVKNCSSLQEANPVISSSRPLGPPAMKNGQYAPFYVVPPGFTGKRRGLLISVVSGEGDDLKGPPNDIQYIHHFLTRHCGFLEKDIMVLRDDVHAQDAAGGEGIMKKSTKQNILDGFAQMVKLSKPKDVVFIQFSGHGGRLGDDLYILPSDYKQKGQIMDYEILQDLIKYMPANVHTTMLVDCCYSGVIGDLPYTLQSKAGAPERQEIDTYYDTNTRQEMIEKEEKGDPEYKEKKQARSKWRNVNRIATAAAAYAKEMAEQASIAAEHAYIASGKAAHAVAESATRSPQEKEPPVYRAMPNLNVTTPASPKKEPKKAIPVQRTGRKRTDHENVKAGRPTTGKSKSPVRSATTPMPPKRTKSNEDFAREMEEAARRAAVARSKKEASALRSTPKRTKSNEDFAREMEDAARRAAVARSRKEASALRSKSMDQAPPRRSRSNVDIAAEREAAERREAKRKAAAARSKTPPPRGVASNTKKTPIRTKSVEDMAFEREVAARRAAVERSRREAASARKKSPMRTKSVEDLAREREIIERRKAVERSKREAAEARAAAGHAT